MEVSSEDAVEKTVKRGGVRFGEYVFRCPELTPYEGKTVLVAWDETDNREQVWVGTLEDGDLIGIAKIETDPLGR